jgi:hypothetical protein
LDQAGAIPEMLDIPPGADRLPEEASSNYGLRIDEAIGNARGILGVHSFSDGLITKKSSGQQIECQQGRAHP